MKKKEKKSKKPRKGTNSFSYFDKMMRDNRGIDESKCK